MDEIGKNSGRWRLIRDESTFLEVVKSLRNLVEENSENTSTSTSTITMQSISNFKMDQTIPPFPNREETITPAPATSTVSEEPQLKKIKARERDLSPEAAYSSFGF
jgi:hypothetical protein